MKNTLFCAVAAVLLLSLGHACSTDDGGNGTGECPSTCPTGMECDDATKKCTPVQQGSCTPACGVNTLCGLDAVCKCQPGFDDCNEDLGKGGNGCECIGECTAGQCNAKKCDVNSMRVCGDANQYCNSGVCAACPDGRYNCDGTLECESDKECAADGCDIYGSASCGSQTQYCDEATKQCKPCDAGLFNCNMSGGDCECENLCDGTACRNECDTQIGCGKDAEFCDFGKCATCAAGRKNCNGSGDCECEGECNGTECEGNKLCDYYDENVCGGNTAQWCNDGACESCSSGKNCNKTKGCECPGECDGNICVGSCSGGECCGDQACQFGEVCVMDALQTGPTYRCVAIPSQCTADPTCTCLSAAACTNTPYVTCLDGAYKITCECTNC